MGACSLSGLDSLPEEEAKQVHSLFLRKLRDAIRPEKIRYEIRPRKR